MKDKLKNIGTFFLGIAIFAAIIIMIYGCYWSAKTVSYSFFYEDMVKSTVVEMVKTSALK